MIELGKVGCGAVYQAYLELYTGDDHHDEAYPTITDIRCEVEEVPLLLKPGLVTAIKTAPSITANSCHWVHSPTVPS